MKMFSISQRLRRAGLFVLAVLSAGVTANAMTNDETAAALKLSKFVLPDYPGILRLQGIPDGETLVALSRDSIGIRGLAQVAKLIA